MRPIDAIPHHIAFPLVMACLTPLTLLAQQTQLPPHGQPSIDEQDSLKPDRPPMPAQSAPLHDELGTNGVVIAVVPVTVKDNDVATAADEPAELPAELSLDGNYPNPFQTETTLVFNLPERAQVRAEVYDILGRTIFVSGEQRLEAGWFHELSLDMPATSSGLYLYRLIADLESTTAVRTGRMVQVR